MGLMEIRELYELYNKFNILFFYGKLPKPQEVKIEWSDRLSRSAGVCYKNRRIIRLSTSYHFKYPEDIESTLLHEMIHLKIKGHGKEFQDELKRINSLGGSVARYSKGPAKEAKWEYICEGCGQTLRKYKRYPQNIICGICRSKFRERHLK